MREMMLLIKELGFGIVGVGAVIFIALKFVDASLKRWDVLIQKMEVFMSRVRDEHDRNDEAHKALMSEHKDITITLGRINGYKS